MSGIESIIAEEFVIGLLAGVAGGRVYSGLAPEGAGEPYVTVHVDSTGLDLMVVGGARIWSNPLLVVKAVAKARGWGPLKPVAAAIDAALQNTSGTTDDGSVWSCVRERQYIQVETPDDSPQYRHLGGYYRLLVT